MLGAFSAFLTILVSDSAAIYRGDRRQVDVQRPRIDASIVVDGMLSEPVWFSSQPTPGTVLFAGYGSSLDERDAFAFRRLQRSTDGFFLKFSYLLRL